MGVGGGNQTHAPLTFLAHQLFVDKDTIVNAVGTSHDLHLLKIDNREDELVTRTNSWCSHLVDAVSERASRTHCAQVSSYRPERKGNSFPGSIDSLQ